MLSSINPLVLREINLGVVFRTIQNFGPIARTDIVRETGLAPSTVSVITAELQEKRLIHNSGMALSSGGRRPILLEVNPAGGCFICVDLVGTEMAIGLLDLSFQVLCEWRAAMTESGEALFEAVVNTLSTVFAYLASAKYIGDRIMVMYGGKVMEVGTPLQIVGTPTHPYTLLLLSSTAGSKLAQAIGETSIEAPDLTEGRRGCPFAHRCPLVTALCRQEEPALTVVASGQLTACHHVA